MGKTSQNKNIYQNFPGSASDYKTWEFLQGKKSELTENLGEKKVRLKIAQNMGGMKLRNILNEQGEKIGEIDVFSNNEFLGLSNVEINEKERGKGYAKAAYKEVVRTYNLPLKSLLSAPEADHIRNSLIKEGVAEVDKKGFRTLYPSKLLSSKISEGFDMDMIQNHPNYLAKMELIDTPNAEMRDLEKDSKYNILEKENPVLNKEINYFIIQKIKNRIFDFYKQRKIPQEYLNNCIEYINKRAPEKLSTSGKFPNTTNKTLRKITKIIRGEILLLDASKKDKKPDQEKAFIWLEMKENKGYTEIWQNTKTKEYKVYERDELHREIEKEGWKKRQKEGRECILKRGDFYLNRHIDENADITNLSNKVVEGKNIIDTYFPKNKDNKRIRILLSSSWLFDGKFHDFRKNFIENENRKEEDRKPTETDIMKVRNEVVHYGGYLPGNIPKDENGNPDYDFWKKFITKKDSSLTRALEAYHKIPGNHLEEGGSFIDLEALKTRKEKETR